MILSPAVVSITEEGYFQQPQHQSKLQQQLKRPALIPTKFSPAPQQYTIDLSIAALRASVLFCFTAPTFHNDVPSQSQGVSALQTELQLLYTVSGFTHAYLLVCALCFSGCTRRVIVP